MHTEVRLYKCAVCGKQRFPSKKEFKCSKCGSTRIMYQEPTKLVVARYFIHHPSQVITYVRENIFNRAKA